uniref:Uncharacterized protein n=1 Tax=uncultured marine virus TaxID=186617 RepID=A0A0F7LB95_9VIRU|nr:hypothetical protein [uncultured marine virus]
MFLVVLHISCLVVDVQTCNYRHSSFQFRFDNRQNHHLVFFDLNHSIYLMF